MRIAVLGSGGIGGYYGALLAKAGHDVSFIARGAHLEAMQQRGLTLRTPDGDSTIPVTAVADTGTVGAVDLVLFCVKSYDTGPAAQALAPLMARDTAVVTFQNGVDNVQAIASVVGSGAVLIGVVYNALQLAGPGLVQRTGGDGKIVLGERCSPGLDRHRSRPVGEVSLHRRRRRRDGARALGHWPAPREPRRPHAPHHLMRGDRRRRPRRKGSASGGRGGSRRRAGRDAATAVAIVAGPRPRRRPSSRGGGPERGCRSARSEARRPDTDPPDDRRLPVGSSAVCIGQIGARLEGKEPPWRSRFEAPAR